MKDYKWEQASVPLIANAHRMVGKVKIIQMPEGRRFVSWPSFELPHSVCMSICVDGDEMADRVSKRLNATFSAYIAGLLADDEERQPCKRCDDTGVIERSEDLFSPVTGHDTRDWTEPCDCDAGEQVEEAREDAQEALAEASESRDEMRRELRDDVFDRR